MKQYLLTALLFMTLTGLASAQINRRDTAESQIRRLEQQQVAALLRNDVDAMEKNWDQNYTVNNPFNVIVKAKVGPIRKGQLTYSSFVREIEKIIVHDKTVIVMGSETVVPDGTSPDAGKTINRRFTNIWMKQKDGWKLVARQASVICPAN
jgi:ketosteroid isomerase-like protein